jgi:flagellar biosynthesis anti-sigma factor FlgM
MREESVMKISDQPRITPASLERPESARPASPRPETSQSTAAQPAARVEFSARARELQAAMESASAAPDPRPGVVEDARRRISDGTYRVEPEQIARRILDRRA